MQTEDPAAFLVVTAATTVLGEGFAPLAAARRRRALQEGAVTVVDPTGT